jgi:hypothetical protein
MSDSPPQVPWQMVFAILGLIGGIVTVWVTSREEAIALKKDIEYLSRDLASYREEHRKDSKKIMDEVDKMRNQMELLSIDIQQIRRKP